MNRYRKLLFKNGKKATNRIVVPPMASGTASSDGCVTDRTLEHYRRLTLSRAGIIFVEYSFVHPSGRSEENQLGISSDTHVAGLAQLSSVIHRDGGALAGIQLTHAGGKTSRALSGGNLWSPSGVVVAVKNQTLETPCAMDADAITVWQRAFVEAAGRAWRAGFDLVELHAAHGYGLNQWLSPVTNSRSDEYGGNRVARLRLLLEIVTEIKRAYPTLLLAVRFPGQEFMPGGITPEDSTMLSLALEAAGVDLLDVSSGLEGWRRPDDRLGEGYLVPEAQTIQRQITLPVIAVGGIRSGDYIDQAIEEGSFQLAAVGRAILEDPLAWGSEVLGQAGRGA